MPFYERWIEEDYNPVILFNAQGKIKSANAAAQFLLGYVKAETLYEYATSYAATSFGFKTTHIALEFKRFSFFAITVGYDNEEEIGIRLYRVPPESRPLMEAKSENFPHVNIYTLIDLCISTNSINQQRVFIKELDPTLPDFRINADLFIKTLNAVIESHEDSEKINIHLRLKTGEYIKIEQRKYALVSLQVAGNKAIKEASIPYIETLTKELGSPLHINTNSIDFEFALMT